MMEELYRNESIKPILKRFPSKNWKSLITLLCEYAVLSLDKQFDINTITFSDLNKAINDIKYNFITEAKETKKPTKNFTTSILNSPNKSMNSFVTMKTIKSKGEKLDEAIRTSPKTKHGKFVVLDDDKDTNEVIIKLNKCTFDNQIKNNKTLTFNRGNASKNPSSFDILDKLKHTKGSNFYSHKDQNERTEQRINQKASSPLRQQSKKKIIVKKKRSKSKHYKKVYINKENDYNNTSLLSDYTDSEFSTEEVIIEKHNHNNKNDKKIYVYKYGK